MKYKLLVVCLLVGLCQPSFAKVEVSYVNALSVPQTGEYLGANFAVRQKGDWTWLAGASMLRFTHAPSMLTLSDYNSDWDNDFMVGSSLRLHAGIERPFLLLNQTINVQLYGGLASTSLLGWTSNWVPVGQLEERLQTMPASQRVFDPFIGAKASVALFEVAKQPLWFTASLPGDYSLTSKLSVFKVGLEYGF